MNNCYTFQPFFYYKVVSDWFSASNNTPTWVFSHFLCLPWALPGPSLVPTPAGHPGCGGGFRASWAQNKGSGLTGWLTGLLSNQLTHFKCFFLWFLSHPTPTPHITCSLSTICTFQTVGVPARHSPCLVLEWVVSKGDGMFVLPYL